MRVNYKKLAKEDSFVGQYLTLFARTPKLPGPTTSGPPSGVSLWHWVVTLLLIGLPLLFILIFIVSWWQSRASLERAQQSDELFLH